jgi:hypothetical protein
MGPQKTVFANTGTLERATVTLEMERAKWPNPGFIYLFSIPEIHQSVYGCL